MRLRRCAVLLALAAASLPAAADYWGDYAGAWLGPRNPERWTDLVARPARPAAYPSGGPRTWDAYEQNPWANTYGTPSSNPLREPLYRPRHSYSYPSSYSYSGLTPMCACYLPSDARSWDGGPLTSAEIARLCRSQCN